MKHFSVAAIVAAITLSFALSLRGQQTNSSSGSASNATINMGNTTVKPQLPQALPGTTGEVGPLFGPVFEGRGLSLYYPADGRVIPMDVIKAMAKSAGSCKIRSVKMRQSLGKNDRPIHIMTYNPELISRPTDEPLAKVYGYMSDPEKPFEGCYAAALLRCKEISGSARVVVQVADKRVTVVKGRSIGLSGTGAGAPTSETGAAAAVGGLIGTNKSWVDTLPKVVLQCMNDGSDDPPELPKKEEEPAPTPTPTPSPTATPTPAATPTPPPAENLTSKSDTQPPTPDPCEGMPQLVGQYGFDQDRLLNPPGFYDASEKLAAFLKSPEHQACIVQVEGHTDLVGPEVYNFGLGGRRALALIKWFTNPPFSIPRDRFFQLVSGGKERPVVNTKGKSLENRRAVVSALKKERSGP